MEFWELNMEEKVILVDKADQEIGVAEKIKAHREGQLHRAFSVFVFNCSGELLLQKRANTKYHSGGLWTNTCCSHPRPGEAVEDAAHRRLKEEMGFDCDLREFFSFVYKVKLDNNLFEHEYDHVFIGQFDGEPAPSPEEVDDWKWMDLQGLRKDIQENPERYTYWFKVCIDKMIWHLEHKWQAAENHSRFWGIVASLTLASLHGLVVLVKATVKGRRSLSGQRERLQPTGSPLGEETESVTHSGSERQLVRVSRCGSRQGPR